MLAAVIERSTVTTTNMCVPGMLENLCVSLHTWYIALVHQTTGNTGEREMSDKRESRMVLSSHKNQLHIVITGTCRSHSLHYHATPRAPRGDDHDAGIVWKHGARGVHTLNRAGCEKQPALVGHLHSVPLLQPKTGQRINNTQQECAENAVGVDLGAELIARHACAGGCTVQRL